MIKLKEAYTDDALQKEKQKDYRNVVILQVIIIAVGLVLSQFMNPDRDGSTTKLIKTVMSVFGITYTFLLWDLLKNFTNNKLLINIILYLLIGLIITGLLVEFPYFQVIEIQDEQTFLAVFHGLYFPIEVIVIGFAIRDIFTGRYLTQDRLWGAAAVYLMIGISFGNLFEFINIVHPGSLGEDIGTGLDSLPEVFYYSFNVLGGLDTAYTDPIKLVRNLAVIEAVWGNLYAILIIGRLLTLPKPDPDDGDKNTGS